MNNWHSSSLQQAQQLNKSRSCLFVSTVPAYAKVISTKDASRATSGAFDDLVLYGSVGV